MGHSGYTEYNVWRCIPLCIGKLSQIQSGYILNTFSNTCVKYKVLDTFRIHSRYNVSCVFHPALSRYVRYVWDTPQIRVSVQVAAKGPEYVCDTPRIRCNTPVLHCSLPFFAISSAHARLPHLPWAPRASSRSSSSSLESLVFLTRNFPNHPRS